MPRRSQEGSHLSLKGSGGLLPILLAELLRTISNSVHPGRGILDSQPIPFPEDGCDCGRF